MTTRRGAKRPNNAGERAHFNAKRGRWEARVSLGHDNSGVLKRRLVTGATAKECQARADALAMAIDTTGLAPDERTTVAGYAEHWLTAVLPSEGLTPKTVESYTETLERYVLPAVGRHSLAGRGALTVTHVEAMLAAMRAKGLSPRTQSLARVTLGKLLNSALRSELVKRNVARLATPPKSGGVERPPKAMTAGELAKMLDALDPSELWYPVALLHAATGLRPGELLGLRWSDLDLDAGMVTVTRSLSQVGGANLKATKRERSRRSVPIPAGAGVVEALKAWRRLQAQQRLAAGPLWLDQWGPLVFTRPDGQPVRGDSYRLAFRRACPAAGIAHHSPHDLRHTYATHLLEAGEPIHQVAELLGDTVATVEAHYGHVLRPKTEVAARIATLLPTTQSG